MISFSNFNITGSYVGFRWYIETSFHHLMTSDWKGGFSLTELIFKLLKIIRDYAFVITWHVIDITKKISCFTYLVKSKFPVFRAGNLL
ncbi:hypothetical protein AT05_02085 [Schleiferia thermophila str. Yellowstone]|nr:hypothetical protein AT05_02085 [Schleiferia thermophila str. Yellowstone]